MKREIRNFASKCAKMNQRHNYKYLPFQSRLPGEAGVFSVLTEGELGKAELIKSKQDH